MDLREPATDDVERVRQVVRSAMTASHALSPADIDAIVADQFGADRLESTFGDGVVRVATDGEDGDLVVGYVEGRVVDGTGELDWLFVDPEHRGRGTGTALFETAVEELRDRGAERIEAATLAANREGDGFFERFGYEKATDRKEELGGDERVVHVYVPGAETGADEDGADRPSDGSVDVGELPGVEVRDGEPTATTDDGKRVFVAVDEHEPGSEAPFFVAYEDADHGERYGYYCGNCGSLDTTVDATDRVECGDCGNTHAPDAEDYDGAYL